MAMESTSREDNFGGSEITYDDCRLSNNRLRILPKFPFTKLCIINLKFGKLLAASTSEVRTNRTIFPAFNASSQTHHIKSAVAGKDWLQF